MTSELKEVREALGKCANYKFRRTSYDGPYPESYDDTKMIDEVKEALTKLDSYIERQESRELAKYQPCGCVVCSCEDDIQCTGCGAKNCGTHKVGEIPNPVKKAAIKVIKQGI